MIALLDTSILIAAASEHEAAPDLSGFDSLAVSTLSWAELVRGLHAARDVGELRRRLARYDALRALFGAGLAFDDACAAAYDRVLGAVTDREGTATAHMIDRMIAATALVHGMTVIARDASGFAHLDGVVPVETR
ncbi:MAG: PIN domain-containing protein [Microbacteriaceae bacterium]